MNAGSSWMVRTSRGLAVTAALTAGVWLNSHPAAAQAGITCAIAQSARDELVLRYVQAVTSFRDAAAEYDAASRALARYIDREAPRVTMERDANGHHVAIGSMPWEVPLFGAGFAPLRRAVDAAEERGRQALNALVAIEGAVGEVIAVTEQVCAAGRSGETRDTDAADATGASGASGASGSGSTAGGAAGQGLPDGFYHGSFDDYYYVAGSSFTVLDEMRLSLSVSCGGYATLSSDDEGEYCSGQWYNAAGEVQGNYEGVIVRGDDGGVALRGLYDRGAGSGQNHWNFSYLSDEAAADIGLSVPSR